jgi:hypothetical protein
MRAARLFPVLLLAALAAGCATGGKRYQVNVGNGRPGLPPVREVEVALDGKTTRRFAQIAPQKTAATRPRSGALPETVTVRWTDPRGGRHEKTLEVGPELDPAFRGQLLVHIHPDDTVELKPLASTGDEISIIPWNVPETWEGSISVPGFNE